MRADRRECGGGRQGTGGSREEHVGGRGFGWAYIVEGPHW